MRGRRLGVSAPHRTRRAPFSRVRLRASRTFKQVFYDFGKQPPARPRNALAANFRVLNPQVRRDAFRVSAFIFASNR
jgi:hypothetical protein